MALYYPLREIRILSGARHNTFGMVRKKGTRPHQGWDLQAKNDSPLLAVSEGEVVSVDRVDNSDYGKSILLRFQYDYEDFYAFYAHINTSLVEKNMFVDAGAHIGFSGSTGNAKGSNPWAQHLHFEMRALAKCGKGLEGRLDPAQFYGTIPYNWMSIDGPVIG